MKELTLRITNEENWIILIFFMIFIIHGALNWIDSRRFKDIFIPSKKISLKKNLFFEPFNIGCLVIISSSVSLMFYKYLTLLNIYKPNHVEFFFFFLLLIVFLLFRYAMIFFMLRIVLIQDKIQVYLNKSFKHSTLLCSIMLVLLFVSEILNNYLVLLIGLIICFFIWIYLFVILFIDYLKNNTNNFIYIIFYIWAVRIFPWLWMFKILKDTKI